MMDEEKREIVPVDTESKVLVPIISAEDAEKAMQAYQELCAAVLIPYDKRIVENGVVIQESDYARIPARRKEGSRWITEYRDHPRKSAWRKLGKFYKVSDEIMGEPERVEREDGSFVYHFTVKAIAPDGQSTIGIGSCDSREISEETRKEHYTKSKAHTRAKNRAVSDLIGFGQVSAEEVQSDIKHVASEQSEPGEPPEEPKEEKPKAKVGDPPHQKKRDKPLEETPEPETIEAPSPPKNIEEVKEYLGSSIIGLDDYVKVSEYETFFRVGRMKLLDTEIETQIDGLVERMSGAWDNENNCWRIPR